MATMTTVTAISLKRGEYAIIGSVPDGLDSHKLKQEGKLRRIETCPGYLDFAGLLSREEVLQYLYRDWKRPEYEAFLEAHPDATFFLIYEYEWESGLPYEPEE
jgi:hypothetical protein